MLAWLISVLASGKSKVAVTVGYIWYPGQPPIFERILLQPFTSSHFASTFTCANVGTRYSLMEETTQRPVNAFIRFIDYNFV